MKELFEGNRALFEGLWIDSSDYDFKPHPVIRLDMTQLSLASPEALEGDIRLLLARHAEEQGLTLPGVSKFTKASVPSHPS
jgi:hypothetical protein